MRLPLAQPIGTRDGTLDKDSKIVNGFVESRGDQSAVFKRPGTTLTKSGLGGIGQGIINWNGSTQTIVSDVLNSLNNTSVYGMTWTARTLSSSQNWHGVAWNGTVFCAISGYASTSTKFATSPDGITWTDRTVTSGYWCDICWNGTVFCAVQGGGAAASTCLTSPDGITWTQRTLPGSADIRKVTSGNGVIVAVINGSASSYYSTDNGVSWNVGTMPSSAQWLAVAWNGTVFCATAGTTSTKAAVSSNGATWTASTLPSSASWESISWNGTVFCAVDGSAASTKAATSPDGITWQARTLPSSKTWTGISWSGTVFCVVSYGSNVAAISTDGATWTSTTLTSSTNWVANAANDSGVICVVAYSGTSAATGVLGTTTYANTTNAISPTVTGLPYDMVAAAPTDANQYLMFKNTNEGYYFNGSAVTKITDVDYPASTVRGIVYLDSTFYVMDSSAKIYGSDLGDPSSWSALNFIIPHIEPGNGVAIAKTANYLAAFKEWSTEFFYDAANPLPGSPLSPVLNNFTLIGCASGASVAQVDKYTFWISQTRQRGRQVHMMVGDQQQAISTPEIERVLGNYTITALNVKAFGLRIAGHGFYCLTLTDSDISIMYDIENQSWYQWSSLSLNSASVSVSSITRVGTLATVVTSTAHGFSDGDPVKISGASQSAYNDIFQIQYVDTTTFNIYVTGSPTTPATGTIIVKGYTETYFAYAAYAFSNGEDFLLHATNGCLYSLSNDVYQDDGVPIDMLIRSAKFDGGSTNPKREGRCEVIGNKISDIAMIRHSDDDYQTYSPYRIVNLDAERSQIWRQGRFRRRSYDLKYVGNNQIQLTSLELDLE